MLRLLSTMLGVAAAIQAQSTKAELFGTVRDQTRLPIDKASIELTSTATGLSVTAISSQDGSYQFLAIPAGDYRLTVTKDGFAALRRDAITLRVGDRLSLDVELRLGDTTQTVDVTAAAPLLQSSRGSVSFVV
ncbi:MAG TPA: carboxypeptidase-like regulatory domain-containing protein, partial [Bryobacteraceae bacterium]|nr:carboxypeptidase-like regulatory domain-containing protein [Bryobacteraceae bacterium]